jgi:hypothetical protein
MGVCSLFGVLGLLVNLKGVRDISAPAPFAAFTLRALTNT